MLKLVGLLSGILLCVHSFAQHNTSSAYSMFGIGEIDNRTYGLNSGMAGTGIGFHRANFLNSSNPAGLHIDSLMFIFDVSTALKISEFSQGGVTDRASNMNLKRVAMGFRANSKWNIHLGIAPFSHVEYNLKVPQYVEGSTSMFQSTFTGSGGLSSVYISNAIKLTPELTVGIKGSFLFGSINRTETASTQYAQITTTTNRFIADFGLQYHAAVNEYINYTLGAVYGYKNRMTLRNTRYLSIGNVSESLFRDYTHLPQYLGVGGSLDRIVGHRKWVYAVDYMYQNWKDIAQPAPQVYNENAHRVSFGIQYTPNYRTPRNYMQRIDYQLGAFYHKSHLKIDGTNLQETGITLGANLPLKNRSVIFLSADLGWKGGKRLIDESYVLFTAGVSLSEVWFMKWVYD